MYGHPLLGYMPGFKLRKPSRISGAVHFAFSAPDASVLASVIAPLTPAEVVFFTALKKAGFFGGDVVAPSETAVDFRNDQKGRGLKNGS